MEIEIFEDAVAILNELSKGKQMLHIERLPIWLEFETYYATPDDELLRLVDAPPHAHIVCDNVACSLPTKAEVVFDDSIQERSVANMGSYYLVEFAAGAKAVKLENVKLPNPAYYKYVINLVPTEYKSYGAADPNMNLRAALLRLMGHNYEEFAHRLRDFFYVWQHLWGKEPKKAQYYIFNIVTGGLYAHKSGKLLGYDYNTDIFCLVIENEEKLYTQRWYFWKDFKNAAITQGYTETNWLYLPQVVERAQPLMIFPGVYEMPDNVRVFGDVPFIDVPRITYYGDWAQLSDRVVHKDDIKCFEEG